MFKRRTPRGTAQNVARWFWPRGGWLRALRYLVYRIRRLPDPAHKIARGIACGVFVCFTPLFGLHFLMAAGLAWLIGGNVLAALLSTFVGNPITFPLIAGVSVKLGSWMMGQPHPLPIGQTFDAFTRVSLELWANLKAVFTTAPVRFDNLDTFLDLVFLPYLLGGLVPGLVAAVLSYALSRPVISAYQKARINRMKRKFEARGKLERKIAQDNRRKGSV
ncbi:DUF2062 domain-containing protein [Palleronia sediminis]|uniref:DUF2062 domain-containing protein n=1 Tax=Palleronia sediminis TaxID=2547833 RepID=A0A4R5ZZP4_9RHOB|nr:DUF2062 domain-containing protein [Palleronia sediminis]TDL75008.1 DUF2062 domain-containing protein [Palleronia sediminis]